ncbi:hypothetical protein Y900_024135 [Mycolicibacterium aromaticivorans JS19b1 = JCM 16368]|uniref:Uncharacterized protein n=1 Tax=Mycolicibacterium aromaticivorans JS19b1 = JCM 16368 TaxID=1440774 RepID=A0A064CQJ0_9MYCO|nr:hypothetical protein [Mycolicibacterium aromaticivorans]KDF01932.1 hypothetical protein Y900_024135 [Mycolicibacterium aromaticivorans JS19b1 = JCM 16368]
MNDDSYPAGWRAERPAASDPRLGAILDDYQPSAALRARAADLWRSYAAREPEAAHTLLDLAADITEEIEDDHRAVVRVLLAMLEHATTTAVGAQGEPLTVRRLASDTAAARQDALSAAVAQ